MKIDIGKVINTARIVREAVEEVARQPDNNLIPEDAVPVAPKVAVKIDAKINNELGSVLQNLANQEPWYQSHVIIGTAVSIIGGVSTYFGKEIGAVDQSSLTELILQLVTVAGSAYALWGRLVTQKPLGQ